MTARLARRTRNGCIAIGTLALLFVASESATADEVCEAPLQVCLRITVDADGRPLAAAEPTLCPDGYECVCVPSCPACRDCASYVCIRAEDRCRSVCDCPEGFDCQAGTCRVLDRATPYCCESEDCPAQRQCQHEDGSFDVCDTSCVPPDERHCLERRARVARSIDRLVRTTSRCRRDDDCVPVPTTTRCQETCGALINRRFADRFDRQLRLLDDRACSDYAEQGCTDSTPHCIERQALCVSGRCQAPDAAICASD